MLNKINLLRFLIVVLFFSSIAIAAETTWRHSGFEISGFDINGSSTYNLTEIRKIEFGWNTSIPVVSDTSRAVMYYDDNQKRIMQSLNGGAYQAIVDNTTVNAYTVNAANATGVLPNASIPASAANVSKSNVYTGVQNIRENITIGNDYTSEAYGIFFPYLGVNDYNYGIYRTVGAWSAPYQQLNISWAAGINLNPGDTYGKSYVDITGRGLNVSNQVYFKQLGAAGAGTALVLSGTNEVIPLSSSNKTKHDIKNVESADVKATLCDITKLDINQFKWDGLNATDYGLIADDTALICPEIVNFATENMTLGGVYYQKGDAISINWAALTSLELQKIKEQEVRLQKLEDRGILDIMFAKQIDNLYNYFNLTKP